VKVRQSPLAMNVKEKCLGKNGNHFKRKKNSWLISYITPVLLTRCKYVPVSPLSSQKGGLGHLQSFVFVGKEKTTSQTSKVAK
jgi:hypothetical protein